LRAEGHSRSEFVGRLEENILEKARSAGLYIKRQAESKPDYAGASGWLALQFEQLPGRSR
jgi:hypothetical protein